MLSINTVAHGSVVLGGLALFAIGHPKADAPLSPTTPGLAVAAAAPAAGPQPDSAPAAYAVQATAAPPAAAPSVVAPAPAAAASAAPAPALATAATSVSGNGFNLASLSVDLPSSGRAFPPGTGVEAAEANCAACHSVGMILNQPSLTHVTWETEVHKMIAVYKAPVSDEDAKTIVAYLDSIKGAK